MRKPTKSAASPAFPQPGKPSKASRRRAYKSIYKRAVYINSINKTNPEQAQSEMGGQLAAFQREAERRANRLTPDRGVWPMMESQDRLVEALDMPSQDKEEYLEDSREACRRAFTTIIPGVKTPLSGTRRLKLRA